MPYDEFDEFETSLDDVLEAIDSTPGPRGLREQLKRTLRENAQLKTQFGSGAGVSRVGATRGQAVYGPLRPQWRRGHASPQA